MTDTPNATAERLPRLLREAADWCDQQQHYLRLATEVIDEERARRTAAVMAMKFGEETIARYETALRSIAANTCCDRCREAALVAKEALGEQS